MRTPTLIFFGTEDRTVSVQQGWLHYRALQQLGKTPVRFVQFPDETHVLQEAGPPAAQAGGGTGLAGSIPLPLGEEGERGVQVRLAAGVGAEPAARRRREGGRFGVLVKGHLVPETAAFGALRVGRFEVTRAQYAAFDKSYPVDAGKENFPAAGLTFEQARNYCAWLSKTTGENYRLPTEDEAEELYDAPRARTRWTTGRAMLPIPTTPPGCATKYARCRVRHRC